MKMAHPDSRTGRSPSVARRSAYLLAEAWRSARAARSFSVLFLVLSFGPAFAIATLAGQAQAQRDAVAEEFSRPDMRTVGFLADNASVDLPWTLATSATSFASVEQAWMVGRAFEVWNDAMPEHGRVAARTVDAFNGLPIRLTSGRLPAQPDEALVPDGKTTVLGIDSTGGVVANGSGAHWAVVGTYTPLHSRAPSTVLVPRTAASRAGALYVTARRETSPDSTARTVSTLLGPMSRGEMSVDMADGAEELGRRVASTVSGYAHSIVVTVLCVAVATMGLLAALMVHSRRQEFGRRRALGASRATIVGLVVLQTGIVVLAGSACGLAAGALISRLRLGVSPSVDFLLSVETTVLCGSVLMQLPAALTAGWRDPVRVLRTP